MVPVPPPPPLGVLARPGAPPESVSPTPLLRDDADDRVFLGDLGDVGWVDRGRDAELPGLLGDRGQVDVEKDESLRWPPAGDVAVLEAPEGGARLGRDPEEELGEVGVDMAAWER